MKATTILGGFVAAVLGCFVSSSHAAGILQPGDTIYAIDLDLGTLSSTPGGEVVGNVLDGNPNTKYLNFGNNWSGFIVTPGFSLVQSMRFTTANDGINRDPAYYVLYGTADTISSTAHGPGLSESWTYISSGSLSLPTTRLDSSSVVNFGNSANYTSYKLLFPATRGGDASMQIGDTQFYSAADGAGTALLNAGTPIVPVDQTGANGSSRNPGGEAPGNILDGNTGTKYLNFGEANSGFIVVPQSGASIVGGFQIWTANDSPERDPSAYALYGMNAPVDPLLMNSQGEGPWSLISSGSLDLPTERVAAGGEVFFANDQSYTAYRFVATSVRDGVAANSMQFSDFELYLIPEPSVLSLALLGLLLAAGAVRRQRH